MKYYIIAEDLATCLVGPFDSIDSAAEHIAFCTRRGDSSNFRIINEDQRQHMYGLGFSCTPMEDRDWTEPR